MPLTETQQSPAGDDRTDAAADERRDLTDRLAALQADNARLRGSPASDTTGLQAQAELIKLRREVEMLDELLPFHCPYEGPPPRTLEDYARLPEPWRAQVAAELGREGLDALRRADERASRAATYERLEAARQSALADLPVQSMAEFRAMPAVQRRQLARRLTPLQRQALCGFVPAEQLGWLGGGSVKVQPPAAAATYQTDPPAVEDYL